MARVTRQGRGLGMIPDLGDIRDQFRFIRFSQFDLPASFSLRDSMPPVGDQGHLGACTAWATLWAFRHCLMRTAQRDYVPSPLAEYYWTRAKQGTINEDSGASIRLAVKTVAKMGAAPEEMWPYDINRFLEAPPPQVEAEAERHQAILYERVPQTLGHLQSALFGGFPVVFGISVYESLETADNGNVPMPSTDEQLLGGHAIQLVGYDNDAARFTWMNQWGEAWGDGGYGTLPYSFVLNPQLASDFWIIRTVEEGENAPV